MNRLFPTSPLPSPTMVPFKLDASTLFSNVDGSTVMLESRVFNESPLNSKRCCYSLTKLMYLLYRGGTLSETEATSIFFSITKAFQSKDQYLRRLVYLTIRELSGIAKDVIIVTSSLTQDIGSRVDAIYRANAIRTLCKVIDNTLIQGIERFMKQSIVDSHSTISSAAIVSCIHLFQGGNREVIRRWVSADLQTPGGMARYHSLGMLFLLRQNDRVSTLKLLQKYMNELNAGYMSPSHSTTVCLLIRGYVKLVSEDHNISGLPEIPWKSLLAFSLNREIVALEAARAICEIPSVTGFDLVSAVSVLQAFLGSSKTLLRFAAIRTLNKLASSRPDQVASCNLDMEQLITDSNRSIATLAITTLLKTGNDASVDRLMSQIKNYMPEISDELKVNIVDAVGALCLKFPAKYSGMLNFLGWRLRDDGSVAYKRAIVSAINDIVKYIPDSHETAMEILCEFVEDCEYVDVASDVLYFLAREGPKMSNPMNYVRHIYNRLLLEVPPVRMAAVGALISFGTQLESLRPTIKVLLQRCLLDEEDDIRDRALSFLNSVDKPVIMSSCFDRVLFSLNDLENKLVSYLDNPANFGKAFDASEIPMIPVDDYISRLTSRKEPSRHRSTSGQASAVTSGHKSPVSPNAKSGSLQSSNAPRGMVQEAFGKLDWLDSDPTLSKTLGPVFRSSKTVDLTEPETEYVVKCTKHIFRQHLALQFSCKNTMTQQVLEDVTVSATPPAESGCTLISVLPIDRLEENLEDTSTQGFQDCIVIFQFDPKQSIPLGSFSNTLCFIAKEVDPSTGEKEDQGTPDEYMLQDLEIVVGDFMLPVWKYFDTDWNNLGEDKECKEVFHLSAVKSIQAAVKNMMDVFGGAVCNQSDIVPEGAASHLLLISGVFLDDATALVRCRIAALATGVAVEIVVRSDSLRLSELIANVL